MRRRLAPIVISLLLSVLLGSFAAGAANWDDARATLSEGEHRVSASLAAEASTFSMLGIGLIGLALFPRSRFE